MIPWVLALLINRWFYITESKTRKSKFLFNSKRDNIMKLTLFYLAICAAILGAADGANACQAPILKVTKDGPGSFVLSGKQSNAAVRQFYIGYPRIPS